MKINLFPHALSNADRMGICRVEVNFLEKLFKNFLKNIFFMKKFRTKEKTGTRRPRQKCICVGGQVLTYENIIAPHIT
jgi:hypothetical protein